MNDTQHILKQTIYEKMCENELEIIRQLLRYPGALKYNFKRKWTRPCACYMSVLVLRQFQNIYDAYIYHARVSMYGPHGVTMKIRP